MRSPSLNWLAVSSLFLLFACGGNGTQGSTGGGGGASCTPNCVALSCGPDGCGGTCACSADRVCKNELCIVPTPAGCTDGQKSGDESDVDCGGSCNGCAAGRLCNAATDCFSGSCNNGHCDPTCAESDAGCGANAACVNTPAARACVCDKGYAGDGGACSDVNECAIDGGPCDVHAACANTIGSFTCTCGNGFQGDGGACADIDECAVNDGGCPVGAICRNQPGTFSCGCADGYTGTAPNCVDINECATNTSSCSVYANCTNTPGSFTCACRSGFLGDGGVCTDINECATNNGGCDLDWGTCANTPGSFSCQCDGGTSGSTCSICTSGWARVGNGPCVKTCATAFFACPTNANCIDDPLPATCICKGGYTDVDGGCTACAPGFTASGNKCVAPIPAGTTHIGMGRTFNDHVLYAINLDAGTITPLQGAFTTSTVAANTNGHHIATFETPYLRELDLSTGQSLPLATWSNYGALTFDPALNAWFLIPDCTACSMNRVGADGGTGTAVGNLAHYYSAAGYDPTNGKLVMVERFGWSFNLYEVDATTGAQTLVGPLPITAGESPVTIGAAVDAVTGNYLLLLDESRTDAQLAEAYCRDLARKLGYPGYDTVPYSAVSQSSIGSGGSYTISSTLTTGKEIVGLITYGNRTAARATLTIDTHNPDAFVCMNTYEEVVDLHLPPTAQFAAAAYTGYQPNLTASVDAGFVPPSRPNFYIYDYTGTVSTSVRSATNIFRVLSNQEASDRRISESINNGDTYDAHAPVLIRELDRATLTELRSFSFPNVTLESLSPAP